MAKAGKVSPAFSFCGAAGSAAVGGDDLIAAPLAGFLETGLRTRQQYRLVVAVAREGNEPHRQRHAARDRDRIGLERDVFNVRADPLDYLGGVGVWGIQQENADAVTGVSDDVGGAKELGDLARHR